MCVCQKRPICSKPGSIACFLWSNSIQHCTKIILHNHRLIHSLDVRNRCFAKALSLLSSLLLKSIQHENAKNERKSKNRVWCYISHIYAIHAHIYSNWIRYNNLMIDCVFEKNPKKCDSSPLLSCHTGWLHRSHLSYFLSLALLLLFHMDASLLILTKNVCAISDPNSQHWCIFQPIFQIIQIVLFQIIWHILLVVG